MDATDLRDVIVGYLVIGEGGPAARWRPVVGDVKVIDGRQDTNWRISPSGTADELFSVYVAAKMARESVPFVETRSPASTSK